MADSTDGRERGITVSGKLTPLKPTSAPKRPTAILRGNLLWALELAIAERTQAEQEMGYQRPSAMLAGWRQIAEALAAGE